ncbi:ferritin-like domain-containing protein [Desulforamulus hydrothermalis]|uniref:Rubrerythrin n=1 Tax=Desulforamulus hydrothermalis Lam5 = DSM 18033 TaxID=1121428 RepID=K8DZQ2_9FIRM|nr:ferritin family protein [Desulforamulus hydrothermalis]CCO08614.1 Rubrerythrin [Desulforamulus hydrothermalis Lam5 = DSM 18033]SHH01134.1 Rubrerythrin [Desulforamulus hydrothermalis Lam5 = DSM 18033]
MRLTINDILDVAIKSEESSCQFYKEMAGRAKNPASANILAKLAQDEQEHLDYLLWLKSGEPINEEVYFDGLEEAGSLDPAMTPKEVLAVAIQRENAAAQMYRQMAEIFKAQADKHFIFERMARDEEHHAEAIAKIEIPGE